MGSHRNRILGTALVAIGLLMLLAEMGLTGLGWLWPTILLVIGAAMLYGYYKERDDSGKVFTAITLVLLACYFLMSRGGSLETSRHWPFFVLAPGFGLLVMSRIDVQRRDAMVPGWIMVGVACVGYFFSLGIFSRLMGLLLGILGLVLKVVVPVGLIALGGWLLFSHRREFGRGLGFPEKVEPTASGPGSQVDENYHDEAEDFGAEADLPPTPSSSEPEDAEFEEEYEDDEADRDVKPANDDEPGTPPRGGPSFH